MLGNWMCSQASRLSKIGFAFACRIATRLSGGDPLASFSTA